MSLAPFDLIDPRTLELPDGHDDEDTGDVLAQALAELHHDPDAARVVLWAIAEAHGHDPVMLCPEAAGYDVSDVAAADDVDGAIRAAREVVAWNG